MLRRLTFFMLAVMFLSVFAGGCTRNEHGRQNNKAEKGLKIVATTSIFADLASNVIGEKGTVSYLVPLGQEPEEFEPRPSDFKKISEADIIFANGLGLESWLEKMLNNVDDVNLNFLTDGAPTIPLHENGKHGEHPDPHLWLDPYLVKNYYVENILKAFNNKDPENLNYYQKNAESYKVELQKLDDWIAEQVRAIPEPRRFIAVSENAFKYYGKAYGFQTEGIWELNSHQEGTPEQISRLVDLLLEKEVQALFVESTVNPQFMEAVSSDSGVPVKGEVYTDALGPESSNAETYIDMMRKNTRTFVKEL